MNIIFAQSKNDYQSFLPLTFTRPIADLRIGIVTIKEKYLNLGAENVSFFAEKYLRKLFKINIEAKNNFLVNSTILPNADLLKAINSLKEGHALWQNEVFIAANLNKAQLEALYQSIENIEFKDDDFKKEEYKGEICKINHLWDLFSLNEKEIENDFMIITKGRKSMELSDDNRLKNKERIFVEEGAQADFSIINPAGGYVYIGKDAHLMENSVIHGSLALCEHSTIKMSAKIYGATTIGPHCKVGGEVSNAILQAYSNKGHDGFLGNSVLGHWCNLGADTNNSNLKNNYSEVKLWNYATHRFVKTGLQFCGLIMGDHSKSSINTMFNTGTVVGVSSNVFGSGFPRNFVPSFAWGGGNGYETYPFKRAIETAELVMKRRDIALKEEDIEVLQYIFDNEAHFRENF